MSKEIDVTDMEIDVPEQLRGRVVRAAASAGQTEQEFMLAAIAEKLERSEGLPGKEIPDADGLSV